MTDSSDLRAVALRERLQLEAERPPALQAVAELVVTLCGTPMSAVTLIQAGHRVLVASVGVLPRDIDIEESLTAYALASPGQILTVEDLRADTRFARHTYVVDGTVRSFHACTLVTAGGTPLGTLAAFSSELQRLGAAQLAALEQLAAVTVQLLEARMSAQRLATAATEVDEARYQLGLIFDGSPIGMFVAETPGVIIRANPAFASMLGTTPGALVGVRGRDFIHPDDQGLELRRYADLAAGLVPSLVRETRFRAPDGTSVPAVVSTTMVGTDRPGIMTTLNLVESIAARRAAETAMLELQSAVDGVVGLDFRGHITSWNLGAERLFGLSAASVTGGSLDVVVPLELRAATRAVIFEAVADGTLLGATREFAAVRADGRALVVELSVSTWSQQGRVGYTAILRDVTRRHAAEREAALVTFAARAANRAETFEAAAAPVLEEICTRLGWLTALAWTVDAPMAALASRSWVRPALWWVADHEHPDGAACPLAAAQRVGFRPGADVIPIDGTTQQMTREQMRRTAMGPATGACGLGAGLGVPVRANGEVVAMLAFGLPGDADLPDGDLLHTLEQIGGVLGRVCEREATAAVRDHEASHDPLTDLVNRRRLMEEIAAAPGDSALLLVDLDRFKMINESLGHAAGDAVLQEATRRLTAAAGPQDTVGRLGGDEFVVIARGLPAGPQAVRARAQQFLDVLRGTVDIDGHRVPLRASLGAALVEPDQPDPGRALRDADAALLLAKKHGKDRVEIFSPAMRRDAATRLDDEAALAAAIMTGSLTVHYQPVVDLASGRATGAEALVRWPRPGHGLVLPGRFVPMAEESGLVVEMGRWVLRRACADAVAWPVTTPGLRGGSISVNVSARQLAHPDFLAHVDSALADSGLPPARLVLEITESSLVTDGYPTTVLDAVRARGIRLALDDFGTGYSSLSYVQRLPVDILKIDKSFVDLITGPGEGTAFTEVVLKLASAMGMSTTAEGVETPAQALALTELGCRSGQGWTWARAVPAAELQDVLPAAAPQGA